MWRLTFACFISVVFSSTAEPATNWPSFRGFHAQGVAEGFKLPQQWQKPAWKTPIPGLAHSCPVIWGNRIFVTTAVSKQAKEDLKIGLYGDIGSVTNDSEHSWEIMCLDKQKGDILWKQTAHTGVPKIKRHPKSTHANCTPATDGKHLVSFFGAEGLYCHDMSGKLLWKTNFGNLDSGYFAAPEAQWGFASSPVIHNELVFIQCDVQTNSFIAALRVKDGSAVWRTARTDVPTWSTPGLDIKQGRSQVIANGFRQVAGYDLHSGRELWTLSGAGDIPVPTPIVAHDLIFITSAHGRLSPIYAIRTDASGNITLPAGQTTNAAIAWSIQRGGNYMQTPLVYGDYLYTCKDNGVLTCYLAKTGQQQYSERLGGGKTGFTASPVAGDGKVYITSEQGNVYVIPAGPKFSVAATNVLGEPCLSTPAIAGGNLYFRTRGHLMAVRQ